MRGVLDFQCFRTSGIVFADTLVCICQLTGGIALFDRIFGLTPGSIEGPCVLGQRSPCVVHPIVGRAECLFAAGKSMFLFGRSLPCAGGVIPCVGGGESGISVGTFFCTTGTDTGSIGVDCPGHRAGRVAVLIDGYALQHGVRVVCLNRINGARSSGSASGRA